MGEEGVSVTCLQTPVAVLRRGSWDFIQSCTSILTRKDGFCPGFGKKKKKERPPSKAEFCWFRNKMWLMKPPFTHRCGAPLPIPTLNKEAKE